MKIGMKTKMYELQKYYRLDVVRLGKPEMQEEHCLYCVTLSVK